LIAVNVGVFIWTLFHSAAEMEGIFLRLSVVPMYVSETPLTLETFLDIFRSMFFHGGLAHLIGNLLYLWLFGHNLEDRMGVVLHVVFYFLSGSVASIARILVDPSSPIPMIGASGAIAVALGGYLVLLPGVRVRGIVPLGRVSRIAEWPAWIVLGMWS
jgi:membrane associated rhomboid family serine protease